MGGSQRFVWVIQKTCPYCASGKGVRPHCDKRPGRVGCGLLKCIRCTAHWTVDGRLKWCAEEKKAA